PVWLMRQAGRYLPEYRAVRARFPDFLSLVHDPEQAAEVTLQPVRRFDLDAAILFSDILVVVEALGWELRFAEGEGPLLAPLRAESDLAGLSSREEALQALDSIFATVRLVRAGLDADKALIGFAGGPWTVATYMLGGGGGEKRRAEAYLRAFAEPALVDRLLAVLTPLTADYLLAQVEAGADVLQIFESWAGDLPEPFFRRWVSAPTVEIITRIKRRFPDLPVIGFTRGAGLALLSYYADSGVDALGLEQNVPIPLARRLLGRNVPLQGNLDPRILRTGGEIMAAEVRRILEEAADGPHVFNLGHGIIKDTPPRHVADLVRLVREG
ncbi:MAG: uroporphyrinogen decarboxylase, partial [Alphaproteobacteria bacterium]